MLCYEADGEGGIYKNHRAGPLRATHDVVIKEFKAPTYEVARTYFLSNECWQRTLKSYAHKPYFITKVASSSEDEPYFKTKVASATKVAYLYRKGQGFPF